MLCPLGEEKGLGTTSGDEGTMKQLFNMDTREYEEGEMIERRSQSEEEDK